MKAIDEQLPQYKFVFKTMDFSNLLTSLGNRKIIPERVYRVIIRLHRDVHRRVVIRDFVIQKAFLPLMKAIDEQLPQYKFVFKTMDFSNLLTSLGNRKIDVPCRQ
jgi:hypothetical protein